MIADFVSCLSSNVFVATTLVGIGLVTLWVKWQESEDRFADR